MDITKKTYERDEVVDKYYERYLKAPDYFKMDILGIVKKFPGKKLLDVGCGPGQFAVIFAESGLDVVGIDYSEAMIRKAKSLSNNKNNPHFKVLDMRELKKYFQKDTFDVIWATASLLHLEKEEIPAVLEDFKYILKPGGYIFLLVKLGEQGKMFLQDNNLGEEVKRKFTFLDEVWFENLLNKLKFSIVEKKSKKASVFKNKPSSWGFYWVKSD